jgi:cysteine desulfurase
MPLYLDYSATAPIHPEVLETMISVYKTHFGNAGSRTHSYGNDAARVVENARSKVASLLGVSPREVVFTSGATESNNLAIVGLAEWGAAVGRKHIVSTEIEHKAVLEPLGHLKNEGFEITLVPPSSTGSVSAEDVLQAVRKDTLLVSVMHVNNETGVIQPVQEIGRELASRDVYFHIDAAQSFGKLVPELKSIHYDLLSLSGHKAYAPQGIGALVVRQTAKGKPPLRPIMFGGGQERGLRPGTLPVALIAGLGKAAELACIHYHRWREAWHNIKQDLLEQLSGLQFDVNGSLDNSLPNIINVSFHGIDSEALMLGLRGHLALSNGSACTSAQYSPSHVLSAMKLPSDRIRGAVRISWGVGVHDIDLSALKDFVKSLVDPT